MKLLQKEFKLAMHPTVPLFMALTAMLFIPNYPYEVIYFYGAMSIFFTCLLGRENNDVFFTVSLPVTKKDAVRARICYSVIIEMAQLALSAVLVVVKSMLNLQQNSAGLDANVALIGMALVLFGLFNLVFYPNYYKNINKVGVSFLLASVAMFALLLFDEIFVFAVPFVRDVIDTPDPQNLGAKFVVLAFGIVFYVATTLAAYKISVKRFEKLDL